MTLFKAWGWMLLASCAFAVLARCIYALSLRDSVKRIGAAMELAICCISIWWVWIALHLAG